MANKEVDVKAKGLETIPVTTIAPKTLVKVTLPDKTVVELEVTNLIEVVEFIAGLIVLIKKLSDGGWWSAALQLPSFAPKAVKAFDGLDLIPAELQFITEKQKSKIIAAIKSEIDMSGKTEEIISLSLDIALKIKALVDILFKK